MPVNNYLIFIFTCICENFLLLTESIRWRFMIKRIFDIVISFFGIILLSPLLVLIGWNIHKNLGSPVLFLQQRPGKHGKPFKMIKFRSMRDAVDASGKPLPNEERMTPFGRKLRSTSLDEFPGLWNVLKGDMSLVGPRPLLMDYLPLYSSVQYRRHEVRPGITGWAQVNGRNAIGWDDKFKLDVWYVDNRSIFLDIKIILMTLKKVVSREGVNSDKEITMPRFYGNKNKALAVLGASGHGKVVADIAEENGWNKIVFFDDAWPSLSKNGAWEVIGGTLELFNSLDSYDGVVVAIGNNNIRYEKIAQLKDKGANLVTLIHPSSVVSKYSTIGVGSVVVANSVVNAYTNIGLGAIVNTASSVGHDCTIGDAVHICPGARVAGGVNIGNQCWIGVGASVRQLIKIGNNTVIGAGAAVVSNFPDNVTAIGVPAKIKI
jgi:sugar O-acyltransferase (sialic acid O-acetyltransferase NeuD family)